MLLVYVDIDDCPTLKNKYGARSVPTVTAFVNEREVDRFVGAQRQSDVEAFLAQIPEPN